MQALIVIFVFVFLFSVLTAVELILLKRNGVDIVAHMKATYDSGKNVKFFFEAFGAIAFVLIQPVVLTATAVWAFGEIAPAMEAVTQLARAIRIV